MAGAKQYAPTGRASGKGTALAAGRANTPGGRSAIAKIVAGQRRAAHGGNSTSKGFIAGYKASKASGKGGGQRRDAKGRFA